MLSDEVDALLLVKPSVAAGFGALVVCIALVDLLDPCAVGLPIFEEEEFVVDAMEIGGPSVIVETELVAVDVEGTKESFRSYPGSQLICPILDKGK